MKLNELLEQVIYEVIQGETDIEISDLSCDSRKLKKNTCFVCLTGAISDGHAYIDQAIANGAICIVTETSYAHRDDTTIERLQGLHGVTCLAVPNTRKCFAQMSAAFFGHPASQLTTIGITGTKGKTTSAYMVYETLMRAGVQTGLIGTVENIIGEKHIPSEHSTPESYTIQAYFREMVEAGCTCVVMEVSSQGLKQHRVDGFTFDIGVFTNLEPDHISPAEHKDFAEYMECKKQLFQRCKLGWFNRDDPHAEQMAEGATCMCRFFGMGENTDLRAFDINLHPKDCLMGVRFRTDGVRKLDIAVNIPGAFSVYNALTCIACCVQMEISDSIIQDTLATVAVRGRMELVKVSDQFTVLLDYAHNAMSLRSLLQALAALSPKRLICLFGCGGNRSRDRRFDMGEISASVCDLTIITTDNPRDEEPQAIIDDILVGVHKGGGAYKAILDRAEAINYCISNAQPGDCICIAGKGHEDYQEIRGTKYHMDDRDLIRDAATRAGYLQSSK